MPALITIVELGSFIRDAAGNLSEQEVEELKGFLAANPNAGIIISGTGGVRKLRWAASGRGKRGGGRVIYYFRSQVMPLYLFNFFTKAEKSDLTEREKKSLSKIVEAIVAAHNRKE